MKLVLKAFWNTLQERIVVPSQFSLAQVCRVGKDTTETWITPPWETSLLVSMLCCRIIYYLHAEVAFWIPLKFFRGFLSHFCCKTLASCLLTQSISGQMSFVFLSVKYRADPIISVAVINRSVQKQFREGNLFLFLFFSSYIVRSKSMVKESQNRNSISS